MSDPAPRWRCECCWRIYSDAERLVAPDPFNEGDNIHACPHCRSVEEHLLMCDEPDCDNLQSCGTPTPDGGYRFTCHEHRPQP